MLFDKVQHWKAKQYRIITQNKNNHLIMPVGTETEMVEIDPVQLVVDFVALISEYAKCKHLKLWHQPISYKVASSKEGQNKIANINTHIFKEQALMEDALLSFVNKYGLFGIMDDEVAGYDYHRKDADGSIHTENYPVDVALLKNDSAEQGVRITIVPYIRYIQKFFPEVPADEAIKLNGADRAIHYAEYMEDILNNKRINDCTEYIEGIDKQSTTPLEIENMNAVLLFKGDMPVYNLRPGSLIAHCHSMFFLNEIAGEHKTVRICQYRRCHRPFTGKTAKYCCEACMRNANKSKKKGDQNNG